MHRSQIILREDQHAYLVNKAQRQGTSISQVVHDHYLYGLPRRSEEEHK